MNGASGPIRVVAMIEASAVTGPAKNLIEFATRARPAADLSIVTFQRGIDTPPNALQREASRAGIPVDTIFERRRFDTAVVPQIREAIARRDPHILQTHNTKSHFLARAYSLARHRPWIAFHHGYTATDFKDRAYNLLNRWSLRRASHAVTVCRPFADHLTRDCGVPADRVHLRHNAVAPFVEPPPAAVAAALGRLSIDGSAPLILAAGRLSREKGHDLLLSALAQLDRPFVCVIAGDGPERAALTRQSAALNLNERVRFAGHLPSLAPLLAAADLLILPSRSEGSPNVLLEAMAAGVPAIAASVGGVPEIATDRRTALLFDCGDTAAIARLAAELLDDPALARQLAAAAREAAIANYSPDAYCRGLLEIYQRALA